MTGHESLIAAPHPQACRCGGSGYVERGPSGATYSYPCYDEPAIEGCSEVTIDGRAIPVVIDPGCEHEGVVYWNRDFLNRPTTPERIVLRTWSERVFLHETLHCLMGDNEQMVRRLSTLYDLGWRLGG